MGHYKIPMVVRQTWEWNNFGRSHRKSLARIQRSNRDFSFEFYDSKKRDEYMFMNWTQSPLLAYYQAATFGQIKADIFRYCITYDLGGFYLDISKGVKGSLLDFFGNSDSEMITFESSKCEDSGPSHVLHPENLICQYVFGFESHHPALAAILREMEKRLLAYQPVIEANPKSRILELTGPKMVTHAIHEFIRSGLGKLMNQRDIDLEGRAIFSLPGSGARQRQVPHYSESQDKPLFLGLQGLGP